MDVTSSLQGIRRLLLAALSIFSDEEFYAYLFLSLPLVSLTLSFFNVDAPPIQFLLFSGTSTKNSLLKFHLFIFNYSIRVES